MLLSSGWEGAKELGVPIFPMYSLFDGEPRSYLEFPNHLIDNHIVVGEPKIPWSWPLEWPLPPSLRTKSCSMFGSRRCQHWMFPVWQGLPVETGTDVFLGFQPFGGNLLR